MKHLLFTILFAFSVNAYADKMDTYICYYNQDEREYLDVDVYTYWTKVWLKKSWSFYSSQIFATHSNTIIIGKHSTTERGCALLSSNK